MTMHDSASLSAGSSEGKPVPITTTAGAVNTRASVACSTSMKMLKLSIRSISVTRLNCLVTGSTWGMVITAQRDDGKWQIVPDRSGLYAADGLFLLSDGMQGRRTRLYINHEAALRA